MQEIVKTLTWTLIHSIWQGLLAALLSAIIVTSTRNAAARMRYNLLGIVMILFFVGAMVTFMIEWSNGSRSGTDLPPVASNDITIVNNSAAVIDDFIIWINGNSGTIILIWTFFFILSCLKLVTGVAGVNRLRHYKTHPVSTDWKSRLEQLQMKMGIRHSVILLQSELVKVPMALGILKPVILLPLGLLTHLPPEQVETILLHELAHIRRRDYLVNLLQHVVEAIFFFNPAIRWISSLIRQEREACCDDIVIASCNEKTSYLNALINFQEYSFSHSPHALGISDKRHYLLNRVKRMITKRNKGINMVEKIALLFGIILLSAFSIVNQKTEVKTEPLKMQQQLSAGLQNFFSRPAVPSVKKEQTIYLKKPVSDTVPLKKVKVRNRKDTVNIKPVTRLNDLEQAMKDANATLQEIIQLKNQIGVKKESIEVMKEQLKTKEGRDKENMMGKIERERDKLKEQRQELDMKRELLKNLKEKQKAKQVEEKHSGSKKINNQEKFTIANKSANSRDMHDESDASDQYDLGDPRDKKIVNVKVDKQEYQYKMGLQQEVLPPAQARRAPEKLKPRVAPVSKGARVKPYTAK